MKNIQKTEILYLSSVQLFVFKLYNVPAYLYNADVYSIIGTSSLRRAAQLRRSFPHLQVADIVSLNSTRTITHHS